MLSPHNYDNICILQNLVFSIYYNVFLFNICMSIHPMTKVTGVLDIIHKRAGVIHHLLLLVMCRCCFSIFVKIMFKLIHHDYITQLQYFPSEHIFYGRSLNHTHKTYIRLTPFA